MNPTNCGTGTKTKISTGIAAALDAAGQGATVITVNKRSARVLFDAYAERMRAAGEESWLTPDIMSWEAFVLRQWSELLYGGRSNGCVLLKPFQERLLWEQVVGPECRALLNPAATASTAAQAWALMKQYRIPVEALGEQRSGRRQQADAEANALRTWIERFESACRRGKWIDSACLCDVVAPESSEGKASRRSVVLFGFDEFTPQQKALLDRLTANGAECQKIESVAAGNAEAAVVCAKDAGEEIQAAASWARAILEREPKARIGIAVPSLQNVRGQIEAVFLARLHPDQLPSGVAAGRRAFEISLGLPLSEYPVIAGALLLLKLAASALPLAEVGALLRSPFLAGGDAEMAKRARLDVRLRKGRVLQISLNGLQDFAFHQCPVLCDGLGKIPSLKNAGSKVSAREWSRWAAEVLDVVGWPSGDRTLSSEEYQAVESWTKMLSDFGALEAIEPAMDGKEFFARLSDCASQVTFEPEKHGAPIQIVGLLEAAGSSFDHLWVMGLHDGAWPERSAPNPLIPAAVQMQYKVPHASPEIQMEFAERVRERLVQSAPDVVLSWPQYEGEVMLRPSTLLAGFARREMSEVVSEEFASWGERLFASCAAEEVCDESGPAIREGSEVKGGTSMLEMQSACPFRGFVELRLAGREMESPEPGLDSRQRGEIVHKTLQFVWNELKSHERLMACSDLEGLVARCVEQAVEAAKAAGSEPWERTLAAIEKERVTALVVDLLALERRRKPFQVIVSEKEEDVELGGLKMRIKADRMDQIDDGRLVLIDYKTGAVSAKSWDGERPEKPQLPAYAATTTGDIAAVSFAQLKAGEVGFVGYSPDRSVLDAGNYERSTPGKANETLATVVARWREIMERLAREHRDGRAAVDPANPDGDNGREPKVCQYCPMPALCRIKDDTIGGEEQDDDE